MFPAFLATSLFALSVIAASRSTRRLGSHGANFGRVVVAVLLLGLWAHGWGLGWGGGAFGWFFASGCIGFGFGDVALFLALPRLGPRLSSLMINCLAAPFAAWAEWQWLGTRLTPFQIACSLGILAGVGLALAPEHNNPIPRRTRIEGILCGIVAGLGQGLGAVISRKAYAVAAQAGFEVDGGTAAYQRILGGFVIVILPVLYGLWVAARKPGSGHGLPLRWGAWREAAPWVTLNGLAGPTVGVACYQWALRSTPSGLVLPITATTPILVIPFTYWLDHDRPSGRSLAGGLLAVLGVAALAWSMT
jgi:drug/metabolite transporter (DMT)-like permease